MEQITAFLSVLSVWSSSLVTIFGALVVICKPFRKLIMRFINSNKKNEEAFERLENMIKNLENNFQSLRDDVQSVRDELKNEITLNQTANMESIVELRTHLQDRIEAVSEQAQTNERDRLKQTIFTYGNYARAKSPISSEEFRYLQQVFQKYTSLNGNDIAHDEFEFITHYYNNRLWENK